MVLDDRESQLLDGSAIRTQLKWFNLPKGFGFVVPEGTSVDAFLHITTLQRAGIRAIGEGATLICTLEKGPKGAQVKDVVEVVNAGIKPERVKAAPHLMSVPSREDSISHEKTICMNGVVKWYKPEKGFGFVTPDDGQKDIFIHKSCLDRYEMDDLPAGVRVSMKVKIVPKGREVLDFQIIEG